MAKAHEIAVAADGRAFDEGIRRGVIKPIEDAEKALKELGDTDAGKDAARDVEKLEDALKDAQRATDKLGDEGRQSLRKVEDSSREASRGVEDMKSEAQQTGREMAASFSEPADALQAIQELSANALVGFGPAGVAAGAAAAVGLGAALAAIEEQNAAAERLKEFLSGAYQAAAEEGRKYLDTATILAEAQDIIFNPDRIGEYNQAQADANKLGLDANDLVLARAGDQESLNIVIERTAQVRAEEAKAALDASDSAIRGRTDEFTEIDRIQRKYEDIAKAHDTEAANAARSQDLKDGLHAREREQIETTARVAGERYAGVAAQYDNRLIMEIDADTSRADEKIAAVRRRATAAVELVVNSVFNFTGKGTFLP